MSNSVSAMVKNVVLSRIYNTKEGAVCVRNYEARSQISRQGVNVQDVSRLIKNVIISGKRHKIKILVIISTKQRVRQSCSTERK